MASVNEHESRDNRRLGKASSLTERETADASSTGKRTSARTFGEGDASTGTGKKRRRGVIIIDILLIVLLCGGIVGGVFGYRALKAAYTPVWEEREMIYCVELLCVDAEALPPYWNVHAPAYASDAADAAPIGYLVDVSHMTTLPGSSSKIDFSGSAETGTASEPTYKSVGLVLRTTARYRAGEGYLCGDFSLLAGVSFDIRVDGISTPCMITSVYEEEEYNALMAADTAADTPATP